MTLEELAYEEAKRAIDRQSAQLDGLRSRAGILLAAISLATSFFGGLVLSNEALHDDKDHVVTITLVGLAIASFVYSAGWCIRVLWPAHQAWKFSLSAEGILGKIEATGADEGTVYRQLAREHESNYDANEKRLENLYRLFRQASVGLAQETFAWLAAFVWLAY
jgi:hypothetical protein